MQLDVVSGELHDVVTMYVIYVVKLFSTNRFDYSSEMHTLRNSSKHKMKWTDVFRDVVIRTSLTMVAPGFSGGGGGSAHPTGPKKA